MQESIIRAEKLNKWFGQVIAINDLSIEIGRGVKGLLGPNGAGKTTFIRIALGLTKPSSGSIRVYGESPRNNPALMVRVGYSPEHDPFFEFMSGIDFIYTILKLKGFHFLVAYKKAKEALEIVKLTDVAKKKIYTYSKGMKQRLKFAVSIASNPDLLYLDEPLIGIDPVMRLEIINIIKSLSLQGKTVIVSSHILHEVEMITEDIILIHRGRLFAEGNVHEIRDLIDKHPHCVVIKTENPRELARQLVREITDIASIVFEGDRTLIVKTKDPDSFYRKLPAIVLESEIEVDELYSPDDNLESVYKYLTEKH
jgi:ABC-2 type transport system ATP-binding protein